MGGRGRALFIFLVSFNSLGVGVAIAGELRISWASNSNSPPRTLIECHLLVRMISNLLFRMILIRADWVLLRRRVSLGPLHTEIRRAVTTSTDEVHAALNIIGAWAEHSTALIASASFLIFSASWHLESRLRLSESILRVLSGTMAQVGTLLLYGPERLRLTSGAAIRL